MKCKKINGIDLYYEDKGEGPALVFIHGLGENASSWDDQIAFFSQSFRTITPDLRGHGRSGDGDEFITMVLMASDIAALIHELDIDQAHFVGLSMGALQCQELTKKHKRLIKTMTLADAAGFYPEEMSGAGLEARLNRIDEMSMEEVGEFVARTACRPDPDPAVLQKAIRIFQSNRKAPYRQASYSTLKADYRNDHAEMAGIPTLILVGDQDIVTPIHFAQYLNLHLLRSKMEIIRQAGHLSKMDNPIGFNRAVLEFLTPFEMQACAVLLNKQENGYA